MTASLPPEVIAFQPALAGEYSIERELDRGGGGSATRP
jgi:hypothetical protein